MKNRRTRAVLLLSLCLLIAALFAVLIASASEEGADTVTVVYPNGTVETYAEGEQIVPIAVPTDFVRYDDGGDAYVYTVTDGAGWVFAMDGAPLADMTVTADMLGKTVEADISGSLGTKKVYYTVHEKIVDETVPEDKRGEFFIYGYDEQSLITYLSLQNLGDDPNLFRYRYLRQQNNEFYIKIYEDMYPTKFDPRWGSAEKIWGIPTKDGNEVVMCQDRTWRGTYDANGNPTGVSGTSASVFFDLNGHTLEIGSSETFHFGSMACTPYSMRLYLYSTVPGAVFSGSKSEAVFYSDDDSMITVGELDAKTVKYGQNLSVYGKKITHTNYGAGVHLLGGRYYQMGTNPDFINISHRLYTVKNCEFYLSDQSEAVLFFNNGSKTAWYDETHKNADNNLKFESCVFHVNQYGTKLIREVSKRTDKPVSETPSEEAAVKFRLSFVDCEFYGIATPKSSDYLRFDYKGETAYSVGTSENFGTEQAPLYISYVKEPTKTRTLYTMNGAAFTVQAICDLRSPSEVATVDYLGSRTYWESGVKPFVQDNVVMTESERYVESEGVYVGLPDRLEAGRTYAALGVIYNKKSIVAFIYELDSGSEGYGLAGDTPEETGRTFAEKVGSLSGGSITLLDDIVLTGKVDFGTKGRLMLDMNGYDITVAKTVDAVGAVHRIGDAMDFYLFSSRPGAVYKNLSDYPIFALGHGGKAGKITVGEYEDLTSFHSGTNLTFISASSFYKGFSLSDAAMEAGAQAVFKAKNCNFLFVGSGAAFDVINYAEIDYAKIAIEPADKNARPTVFVTHADTFASAAFGSSTFYAPDGVNAELYICLDKNGGAALRTETEQTVNLGRCSIHNVKASANISVENLTYNSGQYMACTDLNALATYYSGAYPQGHNTVRGSAEFYIGGKLVLTPVWLCAKESDTARVIFDGGDSGIGSVTEDWLIGSMACRESFVSDGVYLYSYGRGLVEEGGKRLTAGCVSLAPGAMRISLAYLGALRLNFLIPQDTAITAITVGGEKTTVRSTLDYKGNYYLVQTSITPDMLLGDLSVKVAVGAKEKTLTLHLSAFVSALLTSDTVSAEEKRLVYALVEYAELLTKKDSGLDAPAGYDDRDETIAAAPEAGEAIHSVTVDFEKGGVIAVSGLENAHIIFLSEDGSVTAEATVKNGACRFESLPLYALTGSFRLVCGGEQVVYSFGAYKGSLAAEQSERADILATCAYYAAELLFARAQ